MLFRQVCRIVAFRDSLERNVTPPNPSSKSKFHMRRFPFHRQRGHLYFLIMMGRLNITASFRKEQHRPLPINRSSLLTFFPAGGVLNSQNIPTQRKKERKREDLRSLFPFIPPWLYIFFSAHSEKPSEVMENFNPSFLTHPTRSLMQQRKLMHVFHALFGIFFREREKKNPLKCGLL